VNLPLDFKIPGQPDGLGAREALTCRLRLSVYLIVVVTATFAALMFWFALRG
jgi:hypothetical protein